VAGTLKKRKYMKLNKTLMMTAVMAGSLWASGLALQAQDTPTNNPPTISPPAGGNGMRPRPSFDALANALNLTEDQKPKVKPIIEDMQQQIKDLSGDTTLTSTEKRTKRNDIRTATTAKLKDVLTPEQLAKWTAMGPGKRRPSMTPPPSTDGVTPPATTTPPPSTTTPDAVK
jgi:Spy/CpxP family protein refolding chaperone